MTKPEETLVEIHSSSSMLQWRTLNSRADIVPLKYRQTKPKLAAKVN